MKETQCLGVGGRSGEQLRGVGHQPHVGYDGYVTLTKGLYFCCHPKIGDNNTSLQGCVSTTCVRKSVLSAYERGPVLVRANMPI